MNILSKEWFRDHKNCVDKGKLTTGYLTNNVIENLNFKTQKEFINYFTKQKNMIDLNWFKSDEDGIWVYDNEILHELSLEYTKTLFH